MHILEHSFYSNCCVKIKQNSDESDDTQNNPVVTPDTLFAELEKDIITSFSEVSVFMYYKEMTLSSEK